MDNKYINKYIWIMIPLWRRDFQFSAKWKKLGRLCKAKLSEEKIFSMV